MKASGAKRKLAAILSADVAGYSRLMGADEAGTHGRLMACRRTIDQRIAAHEGRVVGTAGDSVLADFPSVVEALGAAVDMQKALAEQNDSLPAGQRLDFRIGINLGDVIVDGDDIFGDGVNVAARLEALADPGGIYISGKVYDEVRNKLDLGFRDRGTQSVKNIAEPVRIYSVDPEGGAAPPPGTVRRSSLWLVLGGVGALALLSAVALWLTLPHWQQEQSAPAVAERQPVSGPGAEPGKPELDTQPTIAVLPFENQSSDAKRDYFSDGVTQDIIAALGRFSNLLVMSWDAVLPYKSGESSLDRVSDDLGVRYVVRGTVRRDDDRVRVAVRLTDAARGTLLWSEHYDQQIDDIFTVQDEITQGVVGALAVELTALDQARAFTKPTDSLDAYDLVLRGRKYLQQTERSANADAQAMFERAIEIDADYASAYASLGKAHVDTVLHGWTEWPERALDQANDLVQRALGLDPSSAYAYAVLADLYGIQGRNDLAIDAIDRAIKLNPNDAYSHAQRGWVMLDSGRSDEAVASLEKALRYNPNSPPRHYANLGLAYYFERRYRDAITTLELVLGQHPDQIFAHIALAATYAEAGRGEDAARAAANVQRFYPFFEVDAFVQIFDDPQDRERIAAALRNAGLE